MYAKPKEKTLTEFRKLNVRMLNMLSRVKYEFLQNQKKKSTEVSPKQVFRIFPTKVELG